MMGWYGGGMGAGGWLGMGLFWVLLVGAIVWLVVALSRSGRGATPAAPPAGVRPAAQVPARPGALEVLDRRLAAGEIDLATYQQVRGALLETGAR